MNIFEDNRLTPAEGEVAVKTYHCTTLDPIFAWFGRKINGYITVTNKRVLYYACGSSGYGATGNSQSCVEVWLPDACNITQDVGTRFSLVRLFLASIIVFLVGSATNLGLAAFLNQAFSQMDVEPTTVRLLALLKISVAALVASKTFSIPYEKISRLALAAVVAGLIANLHLALAWGVFAGMIPATYLWFGFFLDAVAGFYVLWCLYWFIRREYIHIRLAGKNSSMKDPPIHIFAASFWSIINVASSLAANMAPAPGATAMFKELGAIIADIQTLGDHGIKKWIESSAKQMPQEAIKMESLPSQKAVLKYAISFIAVIGVIIFVEGGIDSHQRAVAKARNEAQNIEMQVQSAKPAEGSQWAPNLMSKADQEAAAGKTAFDGTQYKEAAMFWNQALSDYNIAGAAVIALRDAHQDELRYKSYMRQVISSALGKSVDADNINSAVLAELSSYLERHTPDEWAQIKDLANKAESLKKAEQGAECQKQWQAANKLLEVVAKKIETEKASKQ